MKNGSKTIVWAFHFGSLYTHSRVSLPPYKHMDFRVKLNGPAHFIALMQLLTGYISKLHRSIYAVEGSIFHILPELSLE